jgi:hypothetical protein
VGVGVAMLPLHEPDKTMHGQKADILSDSMSCQDGSGQSSDASSKSDSKVVGTQLDPAIYLSGTVARRLLISQGITVRKQQEWKTLQHSRSDLGEDCFAKVLLC